MLRKNQRPLTGVVPKQPSRARRRGRTNTTLKSVVDTERLMLSEKEKLSELNFELGAKDLRSPEAFVDQLRLGNL